jgi:hypothetical protein
MNSQLQSEKIPLPRLVLGLGFFLLFVALGISAAMGGAGNVSKYVAGAAVVAILVGAIGGALQGRMRRGN